MATKERIDVLLVSQGHAQSREQAKRLVMAGLVFSGTEVVDKPGTKLSVDSLLTVKGALHPYASRGGLKLEQALRVFPVSLEGKIVLDVGASTGGFTDCALQHGAKLVYSVDVGYGQLAWALRSDERVRVMERVNFRHADRNWFDPVPTAAVMDVSFISITKLFDKLKEIVQPSSPIVTLVKPQFEAGPSAVSKGGIVRDKDVHTQVLQTIMSRALNVGLCPMGLTFSPIRGGDGNIEFLLWLMIDSSGLSPSLVTDADIENIVSLAHAQAK